MKGKSLKLIKSAAITVVSLGLALSACAHEKPAAEVVVGEAAVQQAVATEPEPPERATLGDTLVVGDWQVRVTEFATNANDALAHDALYNEKPQHQYALVTYEATYDGDERTADGFLDLTWSLTTTDQQIHQEDWATTPADKQSWPTTARPGGTVKVQVAFDVEASLVDGGILSVEDRDAELDTGYADFAL